jgi:hypothetical protein
MAVIFVSGLKGLAFQDRRQSYGRADNGAYARLGLVVRCCQCSQLNVLVSDGGPGETRLLDLDGILSGDGGPIHLSGCSSCGAGAFEAVDDEGGLISITHH